MVSDVGGEGEFFENRAGNNLHGEAQLIAHHACSFALIRSVSDLM